MTGAEQAALRSAHTAQTSACRVELRGEKKPPNCADWHRLSSCFPGNGRGREVLRTERYPSSNSRPRHRLQTTGAQSVYTRVCKARTHAYLKRLPSFPKLRWAAHLAGEEARLLSGL